MTANIEIPTDFEMYSAAGNRACINAAKRIVKRSASPGVRNHAGVLALAVQEMARVAKTHREVYDTEPRYHFGCVINRICKANGWEYDPYDSGL